MNSTQAAQRGVIRVDTGPVGLRAGLLLANPDIQTRVVEKAHATGDLLRPVDFSWQPSRRAAVRAKHFRVLGAGTGRPSAASMGQEGRRSGPLGVGPRFRAHQCSVVVTGLPAPEAPGPIGLGAACKKRPLYTSGITPADLCHWLFSRMVMPPGLSFPESDDEPSRASRTFLDDRFHLVRQPLN